MTKQELGRHLELQRSLNSARELLQTLEAAAAPRVTHLDGMPNAHGAGDPVGCLAAEIADARTTVEQQEAEVARSREAVEAYIQTIGDLHLRMFFRLRFLQGLTWKEVAAVVGGGNTEDGVKAACYRWLGKSRAER